MAPILTLHDTELAIAERKLCSDVNVVIEPRDRLALVGSNGSGKSTLLRHIAGRTEADKGTRYADPGLSVGYLEQSPTYDPEKQIATIIAEGLPPHARDEIYRVEEAAAALGIDTSRTAKGLSGGEMRRVSLAQTMVWDHDLLLLDEPTNHLDLAAIGWLEARLAAHRGAYILISHDRAFLTRLTTSMLWLNRGIARFRRQGFSAFETWEAEVAEEEAAHAARLDQHLKQEERWMLRGVTARRKRNQGRLRKVLALREERRARPSGPTTAAIEIGKASGSGKRVLVAEAVSKSFGQKTVIRDLSLTLQRGERIGIVGPNGAGKSTLIKLMMGEIEPDTGRVTKGTQWQPLLIDQKRARIAPGATVEDVLADGNEWIDVRGVRTHVTSYLKSFLFDPKVARQPADKLSGGEQNRLLLARALARPANLIVLDEPTNDLDLDTLELLEEQLASFEGTLILVSHDRAFLDNLVTSVLVLDGQAGAEEFVGGFGDLPEEVRAKLMGGPSGRVAARSST
ncbi:MAG: ABC-F family ATP-binding cassette domain-containing protein, partial [Pseudomonadota bacterium]